MLFRSGKDGTIYGSVTTKDIADELSAQADIAVDKRKIMLDNPLKTFGMHTVEVKLHAQVVGKINVLVNEEK